MVSVSNREDILDSRDVIARIAELESEIEDSEGTPDVEVQEELDSLLAFAKEGEEASDWQYGETCIRESYFVDYAKELAEDVGAIGKDATWPACHIDWKAAADALKADYIEADFSGVTYLIRA